MNAAAVHLALNHLPVLGLLFALALYGWGMWRRARPVMDAALYAMVGSAVIAWPVWLSGGSAEDLVETLPGVLKTAIEAHESMAVVALIALQAVGVSAILTLVLSRNRDIVACAHGTVVLVGLVGAVLVFRAAGSGGEIRHAAEMSGAPAVPPAGAGPATGRD